MLSKYVDIDYKFKSGDVITIHDLINYTYRMQLKIEQLDDKLIEMENIINGLDK